MNNSRNESSGKVVAKFHDLPDTELMAGVSWVWRGRTPPFHTTLICSHSLIAYSPNPGGGGGGGGGGGRGGGGGGGTEGGVVVEWFGPATDYCLSPFSAVNGLRR